MKAKTKRRVLLLLFAAGLAFAGPRPAGAADFLIKVTLLKGIPENESPTVVPDTVVTTFRLTAPRPEGLGPEIEPRPSDPSYLDELARIYRLGSVEDLIETAWPWSGAGDGLGGFVQFGRETFRLEIQPAFVPPAKMKLAIAVSKPRRQGHPAERVLGTEIIASLDDRVVAGFMADGRSYFLSILVTRDTRKAGAGEPVKGAPPAWLPASKVPIVLPQGLTQGEVQGDVILEVSVDAAGKVTDVRVLRSLRSDIDDAAARAVKQWTFEPAETATKAGPSTFGMSFRFTRRALEPPAEPGEEPEAAPAVSLAAPVPAPGELGIVLAACADYCQRLSEAALDFVCEERIAEELYDYHLTYGPSSLGDVPSGISRQVRKNSLLYDFQLIQGPGGIRENRTLLEENGEKRNEKNVTPKTRRFYSYRSIYGPVGLFSRDRWPLFDYRLAGRDTVAGRRALVIEVTPKPEVTQPVTYGKAWVDLVSRRILKIEIDAKALAGFDKVAKASDLNETRPLFTTVHYYETEKNGLMFPSRTVFKETYLTSTGRRVQRSKTEIAFTNYRFFTVSVEVRQ